MQSEYDSIGKEQTKTATELAYAKVISYNRKNLRENFRTIADSITDNKAIPSGGRKKFNENSLEIWMCLWYSVKGTNRNLTNDVSEDWKL